MKRPYATTIALVAAAVFGLWWWWPTGAPRAEVELTKPRAPHAAETAAALEAIAAPASVELAPAPELPPTAAPRDEPSASEDDLAARLCSPDGLPDPRARPQTLIAERSEELSARLQAPGARASSALSRAVTVLTAESTAPDLVERLFEVPGRLADGFDIAAAVALTLGVRALNQRQVDVALTLARLVTQRAPQDPLGPLFAAWVNERQGDFAAAERGFRGAVALAPEEPALRWSLGNFLLYRAGEPAAAAAELDAYLELAGDDIAARALRGRATARAEAQRSYLTIRNDGVTLRHPPAAPLVGADLHREVLRALDDAAELLDVERRPALAVVVYPTVADLATVACATDWTGALFDGTIHLVLERLTPSTQARVVRHEVMHASLQIASGMARVPYWFEEGLAQHFASDDHRPARQSWTQMVENETYVPFPSLEGSFMVIDDTQGARLAYDQSLAMVLWMADRDSWALSRAATTLRSTPLGQRPRLLPGDLTGRELLYDLRRRLQRSE